MTVSAKELSLPSGGPAAPRLGTGQTTLALPCRETYLENRQTPFSITIKTTKNSPLEVDGPTLRDLDIAESVLDFEL